MRPSPQAPPCADRRRLVKVLRQKSGRNPYLLPEKGAKLKSNNTKEDAGTGRIRIQVPGILSKSAEIMLALVMSLLGAGLATLGVFLFISQLRMQRLAQRRFGGELVSLGLLVGGGTLLLSSITSNENSLGGAARFDPNLLLEKSPTAAGKAQTAPATTRQRQFPFESVLVLGWGTPSDLDSATPAAVAGISGVDSTDETVLHQGRDASARRALGDAARG